MKIGEVLSNHRWVTRQGVRACAKEIGISPATLSRLENGSDPDTATMHTIWGWLTKPEEKGD